MIIDFNKLYSVDDFNHLTNKCIYCNKNADLSNYKSYLYYECENCLFLIEFVRIDNTINYCIVINYSFDRKHHCGIEINYKQCRLYNKEHIVKKLFDCTEPVDLIKFKTEVVDKYRLLI